MIELKNVSKTYKQNIVFDQLSLKVDKTDKVLLTGPNGRGKTTLLNLLAGSLTVDSGEILFDDKDWKEELGYVGPNSSSFFPELSGIENLKVFGISKNKSLKVLDEEIKKYLAMPEFSFLDNKFLHYSSGMKQKLNFLRGIVHCPRYLLLDEPLENLDESSRLVVLDILQKFEGLLIVASHKKEQWENIINRLIDLETINA